MRIKILLLSTRESFNPPNFYVTCVGVIDATNIPTSPNIANAKQIVAIRAPIDEGTLLPISR